MESETTSVVVTEAFQTDIREMIYSVRGQQVMLDSDLAMLYQVETKVFNQAVKRNIARFPDNFRFQLSKEEFDFLRSQFVTSKKDDVIENRGGRRYLPFAFTEQGIAMLSAVLKSDVSVQVSINIMNTFVELRKFVASNAAMFERISAVELRQLQYQEQTDAKLEQIFDYISEHEESTQKVFFDGQIYDAFGLIVSLIQKAEKSITLIDGYVDVNTLNLLCKKNDGVDVTIYTYAKTKLTGADVITFNAQYPTLTVEYTNIFHDRFLILDEKLAYHIGASLKDAGKKCFAISLLQDKGVVGDILQRLKKT